MGSKKPSKSKRNILEKNLDTVNPGNISPRHLSTLPVAMEPYRHSVETIFGNNRECAPKDDLESFLMDPNVEEEASGSTFKLPLLQRRWKPINRKITRRVSESALLETSAHLVPKTSRT